MTIGHPGHTWPYALLNVLLVGLFLVATVVPRFGTLWHTHEHGRAEHTHAHLFTTPEAQTHAHAVEPQAHQHEASEPVALSESEDADRHWHAFADALPVGVVSPLRFFLVLYAVFLVVYRRIAYWSRLLLSTAARAPPG